MQHQVPHPPSPPETIRSTSPGPNGGPPRGLNLHGDHPSEDDEQLREIQERERSHERIIGGLSGISSVKALAERERKGARRQSLTYSFSTPTNRPGLDNVQQGQLSHQRPRNAQKKWLVLVVPPAVLPHSPPPTQVSGFANAYGAAGRFAGGILLPLQPTLPAQLALIAREFSLPSLGGVSLYLCLPAELESTKPRLLDETWSILWHGHFDDDSHDVIESMKGVGGLPIAARLEFDIDPRKSRWLQGWLDSAASTSISPPLAAAASFSSPSSSQQPLPQPQHSTRSSTSSTTSTATLESSSPVVDRSGGPRPLSLLASRRASPPLALGSGSLRTTLISWPTTPTSPERDADAEAGTSKTSDWMEDALHKTAKITFDPVVTAPGGKESRTARFVERDWDMKLVPLSEISGTPTPSPGPEDGSKQFRFGGAGAEEEVEKDMVVEESIKALPAPKGLVTKASPAPAPAPKPEAVVAVEPSTTVVPSKEEVVIEQPSTRSVFSIEKPAPTSAILAPLAVAASAAVVVGAASRLPTLFNESPPKAKVVPRDLSSIEKKSVAPPPPTLPAPTTSTPAAQPKTVVSQPAAPSKEHLRGLSLSFEQKLDDALVQTPPAEPTKVVEPARSTQAVASQPARPRTDQGTRLSHRYPFFHIYPSVFPHVHIYPSLPGHAVAPRTPTATTPSPSPLKATPEPLAPREIPSTPPPRASRSVVDVAPAAVVGGSFAAAALSAASAFFHPSKQAPSTIPETHHRSSPVSSNAVTRSSPAPTSPVLGLGLGPTKLGFEPSTTTSRETSPVRRVVPATKAVVVEDRTFERHTNRDSVVSGLGMGGSGLGWKSPKDEEEEAVVVAKEVSPELASERPAPPPAPTPTPAPTPKSRDVIDDSLVSGLGMGHTNLGWDGNDDERPFSLPVATKAKPKFFAPRTQVDTALERPTNRDSIVLGLGLGGSAIAWMDSPTSKDNPAADQDAFAPVDLDALRQPKSLAKVDVIPASPALTVAPAKITTSLVASSSTAYPTHLYSIYPQVAANVVATRKSIDAPAPKAVLAPVPRARSTPKSSYPRFELYPAVYPHFALYPSTGRTQKPIAPVEVVHELSRTQPSSQALDSVKTREVTEDSSSKPSAIPAIVAPIAVAAAVVGASVTSLLPKALFSKPTPAKDALEGESEVIKETEIIEKPVVPAKELEAPSTTRELPPTKALFSEPASTKPNLSTRLAHRYPYFNIYAPVFPHVHIYPSLPGHVVVPAAATKRRTSNPRAVPVPLILSPNPPSFYHSSYPSTAASPDRLESATLESRLIGSGSGVGQPERQFPLYDPAEDPFSDPTATGRRRSLVEPDRSIKMVSLADASLPSPTSSTYSEQVESDNDIPEEDEDAIRRENESGEESASEDGMNELSINAPSSPVHNYSSLFLPPPMSPAFAFSGSPSPTINASQLLDQSQYADYATAAGHPDDRPFVLSPTLENALGFQDDDSPLPRSEKFYEDENADDDSSEEDQYVVLSPAVQGSPSADAPPSAEDPLAPVLFSFPEASKSDDLAAAVAQYVIEAQTQSIQRRGRFCCALSGGSMPKILAEGLLNDDRLRWDKWEVFFVDERLVPLDDPESTFKAYDDALFSKVPIPAWQIHSIKSLPDLTNQTLPATAAEEIASDMETQLLASFPDVNGPGLTPGPPRFDLVMLGMGPDGHCASLFPGHALLDEKDWWVAYLNDSPKPPLSRITFTMPLLSASRRLAFVCTGAAKSDALANALDQGIARDADDKVPAGRIVLDGHPVVWFADENATNGIDYPTSSFWNDDE